MKSSADSTVCRGSGIRLCTATSLWPLAPGQLPCKLTKVDTNSCKQLFPGYSALGEHTPLQVNACKRHFLCATETGGSLCAHLIQSMAGQGKTGQGRAGQDGAGQGRARQGKTRQGKSRQGRAGQSRARQGSAEQGNQGQGSAGQTDEVDAWKGCQLYS